MKIRSFYLQLRWLLISLLAFGTSPGITFADSDLSRYVSSELPPDEQKFVLFHMNQLPRAIREKILNDRPEDSNVIIVDPGMGIHYNRKESVGTFEFNTKKSVPGSEVTPKSSSLPWGPFSQTGPYRRVYTKPITAASAAIAKLGVGWMTGADVSIKCLSGSFKSGEGGFVYLGGWSPTARGGPLSVGSSVDAGLQYNFERSDQSNDDYSPFISVSSYGYVGRTTSDVNGPPPPHVPCSNSLAHITFGVEPTDGWNGIGFPHTPNYGLVLSVESAGTYKRQVLFFMGPNTASEKVGVLPGGWGNVYQGPRVDGKPTLISETPCLGCVFKWMTSIAQPPPGSYHDGSQFSAIWKHRTITCNSPTCSKSQRFNLVPLPAAIINCSEYPLWHGGKFADSARDCTNTPSGTSGVSLTNRVSGYSSTGETDLIRLNH